MTITTTTHGDAAWQERCRDVALDCAYDNPGDEPGALAQFRSTSLGYEDLGFGDVVEDEDAEQYVREAEATRVKNPED